MSAIFSNFFDGVSPELKDMLCRDPDAVIDQSRIIKNDRTTTVAELQLGNKKYLVKRYNARSFGHRLKRSLRQSRASICWNASSRFSHLGLNVANPVAMLERRSWIFKGDAYFVSDWLDGDELLTWLPEQGEEVYLEASKELGNIFNIFEKYKLSHGDMKASNLLWVNNRIYLVDLDSSKSHKLNFLWYKANVKDRRRFEKNGAVFMNILKSLKRGTK